MTPSASLCPVTDCSAKINTLRFLMCGRHWMMVPQALAREVYRTWGVRQRMPLNETACSNHEAAKTAAIEAVNDLVATLRSLPA